MTTTIEKTVSIDLWDDVISGNLPDVISACLGKSADNDVPDEQQFSEVVSAFVRACNRPIDLDKKQRWLVDRMTEYKDCETPFDGEDELWQD